MARQARFTSCSLPWPSKKSAKQQTEHPDNCLVAKAAVHELDVDCLPRSSNFFTDFLIGHARCGNIMAISCHLAKWPSIYEGRLSIRNEQVVGSNPTSGSISLGFIALFFRFCRSWRLRYGSGGSRFHPCQPPQSSIRLRHHPGGWFPFLLPWPPIVSGIGNFLRLSERLRDTPQSSGVRTMPVIGRG